MSTDINMERFRPEMGEENPKQIQGIEVIPSLFGGCRLFPLMTILKMYVGESVTHSCFICNRVKPVKYAVFKTGGWGQNYE